MTKEGYLPSMRSWAGGQSGDHSDVLSGADELIRDVAGASSVAKPVLRRAGGPDGRRRLGSPPAVLDRRRVTARGHRGVLGQGGLSAGSTPTRDPSDHRRTTEDPSGQSP